MDTIKKKHLNIFFLMAFIMSLLYSFYYFPLFGENDPEYYFYDIWWFPGGENGLAASSAALNAIMWIFFSLTILIVLSALLALIQRNRKFTMTAIILSVICIVVMPDTIYFHFGVIIFCAIGISDMKDAISDEFAEANRKIDLKLYVVFMFLCIYIPIVLSNSWQIAAMPIATWENWGEAGSPVGYGTGNIFDMIFNYFNFIILLAICVCGLIFACKAISKHKKVFVILTLIISALIIGSIYFPILGGIFDSLYYLLAGWTQSFEPFFSYEPEGILDSIYNMLSSIVFSLGWISALILGIISISEIKSLEKKYPAAPSSAEPKAVYTSFIEKPILWIKSGKKLKVVLSILILMSIFLVNRFFS